MSTHTYRALLIANSTFPDDPQNLHDLEGPRNDPALLRDALCDRRYGLFPSDNVRLVVERTMAEVLREAEEFLRSANRQDTLLLYYSGHGLLDLAGHLYLCTRDTRADRLRSTSVKATDLDAMIDDSAAATTIILLDCCHSGAFKGGDVAQALAGDGRFVVSSCRSGALADDADARNRASRFTSSVVDGLLGGAPDHDGDGFVGLDELYSYVHGRLAGERRQIPQRRFAGVGDVPLARRISTAPPDLARQSVVDPSSAPPVLDVSETAIELRDVAVGEPLPPERVAVVNRGGGELRWSAECAAPWVQLERDVQDLVLHLRPGPGTNRANVTVRDERTGMVKTIRLVVRATAPAPSSAPLPVGAPQPGEPPSGEAVPRGSQPAAVRSGRPHLGGARPEGQRPADAHAAAALLAASPGGAGRAMRSPRQRSGRTPNVMALALGALAVVGLLTWLAVRGADDGTTGGSDPAPVPGDVQVQLVGPDRARVMWQDATQGQAAHIVIRNGDVVREVAAPSTELLVDLVGGDNCFRVRARLGGVSEPSAEDCITMPAAGEVLAVVDAFPVDDIDAEQRAQDRRDQLLTEGHDAAVLDTRDFPDLDDSGVNHFYVYVPGFASIDAAQDFCDTNGFTCVGVDLS